MEFEKPDGRQHLLAEDVDGFTHHGITIANGEAVRITVNRKR